MESNEDINAETRPQSVSPRSGHNASSSTTEPRADTCAKEAQPPSRRVSSSLSATAPSFSPRSNYSPLIPSTPTLSPSPDSDLANDQRGAEEAYRTGRNEFFENPQNTGGLGFEKKPSYVPMNESYGSVPGGLNPLQIAVHSPEYITALSSYINQGRNTINGVSGRPASMTESWNRHRNPRGKNQSQHSSARNGSLTSYPRPSNLRHEISQAKSADTSATQTSSADQPRVVSLFSQQPLRNPLRTHPPHVPVPQQDPRSFFGVGRQPRDLEAARLLQAQKEFDTGEKSRLLDRGRPQAWSVPGPIFPSNQDSLWPVPLSRFEIRYPVRREVRPIPREGWTESQSLAGRNAETQGRAERHQLPRLAFPLDEDSPIPDEYRPVMPRSQ